MNNEEYIPKYEEIIFSYDRDYRIVKYNINLKEHKYVMKLQLKVFWFIWKTLCTVHGIGTAQEIEQEIKLQNIVYCIKDINR